MDENMVTSDLVKVREGVAVKTGMYGDGKISYAIFKDVDRHLYIQIVSNEGSGKFSKEFVSWDAIEEVLSSVKLGENFKASLLKSVFKGRSSNNIGFMVAVLMEEGVVAKCVDRAHSYFVKVVPASWRDNLLGNGKALKSKINPVADVI